MVIVIITTYNLVQGFEKLSVAVTWDAKSRLFKRSRLATQPQL